jgi:hypothetical protein
MKATKKVIPALLGDPQTPNMWLLSIRTKYDWCEMKFSNKQQADSEYKRIKAQGTFGGAWLTEIHLEELYQASEGNTND